MLSWFFEALKRAVSEVKKLLRLHPDGSLHDFLDMHTHTQFYMYILCGGERQVAHINRLLIDAKQQHILA